MGAVIEFKRPEPAPAKPSKERITFVAEGGRKIAAEYLDSLDSYTRFLFDERNTADARQDFLNRWRAHWKLDPLEYSEARREN